LTRFVAVAALLGLSASPPTPLGSLPVDVTLRVPMAKPIWSITCSNRTAPFGRIDVEADDLVQFGGKLRIIGQLELANPVRLEAMSTPYRCTELTLIPAPPPSPNQSSD
jgi:hypothetical protein